MKYQLGLASHSNATPPDNVPVSFNEALLCSSPVPPLATVKEIVPLPVTLTVVYPFIAFSLFSRLSFVLDPHVPALAPVA